MYDRVKAEHEVVDYLDLLIKLRDLLRDKPEIRRFYQGLFDHIFVDEFQDTDPLQCEIVFYLCEDRGSPSPGATWDALRLAPGKLTIVGDPKQSIYRFRRADIEAYHEAKQHFCRQGDLLDLSLNFRSRPLVVDWVNALFSRLIQPPEDGFYQPD